jgi:ATP-dependent DNA helicase RecQ
MTTAQFRALAPCHTLGHITASLKSLSKSTLSPLHSYKFVDPAAPQMENCEGVGADALLSRALLLDLEVSPAGRILKIGATIREMTLSRSGTNAPQSLAPELTRLSSQAECLLGHNLIRHDIPVLRQHLPGLHLFRLPVIDTLILSPICFPENPYHRLVKDYKLVRESMNDPVADARQAAVLFSDEFQALNGLRKKEPQLFDILHFLLATPEDATDQLARGMALLFETLGGSLPSVDHGLQLCREFLPRWGCARFPVTAALLQTQTSRLALAYACTWLRVAGLSSVLPPWVRLQYPETMVLIQRLREVPCADPGCTYCRTVQSSTEQLKRFFSFPGFRPVPQSSTGSSLQQEIVEAGNAQSSLCWQSSRRAVANPSAFNCRP